jgi:hypothetical protein
MSTRPKYLYKRVNSELFVRFDPTAVPGSPEEYVLIPADQVPPNLVPVTGPARLSQTASTTNTTNGKNAASGENSEPVRRGPPRPGTYRRL